MWEHHHTQIGATVFIFFIDIIIVPLHNWDSTGNRQTQPLDVETASTLIDQHRQR